MHGVIPVKIKVPAVVEPRAKHLHDKRHEDYQDQQQHKEALHITKGLGEKTEELGKVAVDAQIKHELAVHAEKHERVQNGHGSVDGLVALAGVGLALLEVLLRRHEGA